MGRARDRREKDMSVQRRAARSFTRAYFFLAFFLFSFPNSKDFMRLIIRNRCTELTGLAYDLLEMTYSSHRHTISRKETFPT